jgi:hypothetical protein
MKKQCPFGIECDNCRFFKSWILTSDKGEQKVEDRCGFEVLFDEIPRIRGSVDGCQAAANESRNRVMEFGRAAVETILRIEQVVPKLLSGSQEN